MNLSASVVKYIEIILNKKFDNVVEDDLKKITNLVFSINGSDDNEQNKIDEILVFNELESLSIINGVVGSKDIAILSKFPKLKNINFENCIFDKEIDFSIIKSLESLSFRNCQIGDYSILSNQKSLKYLEIKFPNGDEVVDAKCFERLSGLNKLILEGCIIINENSLIELNRLELLYLLLSELSDLSFVNKLVNLKKLYIPNYYLNYIDTNNTRATIFTSSVDLLYDDIQKNEHHK